MAERRQCPFCPSVCAGEEGLVAHAVSLHRDEIERRTIVWEDPPPNGRPPRIGGQIRAKIPHLRNRPGEWGRLYEWVGSTEAAPQWAVTLRRDRRYAGFEFRGSRVRTSIPPRSLLFGRFVG